MCHLEQTKRCMHIVCLFIYVVMSECTFARPCLLKERACAFLPLLLVLVHFSLLGHRTPLVSV